MTEMILGEEGQAQFQSFKLNEEDHKDIKTVWECFAKSKGGTFTYWIDQENYIDLCKDPVCCVEPFEIKLTIHLVKNFKVCQWAHE